MTKTERINKLEKENEDLKNKNFVTTQLYNNALTENKGLKDIITELRKENKQLQTRFHIVPEHYLTEALDKCNELERKNAEQKEIIHELHKPPLYDGYSLQLKNEELKAFCTKLIKANNELRESLRKYEIVPDVDYLPNGLEVYKENVGNNPYGIK